MSRIFEPRKYDPFTAINAIVTREDDEYITYYTFSQQVYSDDGWSYGYWCNAQPFGNDLAAASAYADRLAACADDEITRELSDENRSRHGNYQGCWNAPIVYETSKRHAGLVEPWTR